MMIMEIMYKIYLAFIMGFNLYLDKKDIDFYRDKVLKLYSMKGEDLKGEDIRQKMNDLTKPVDRDSMNYIYENLNRHFNINTSYFLFRLFGLLCIVILLYDLEIFCLEGVRKIGLLYIIVRIINVLFKIFSNFTRFSLILKKNSILNNLTGFVEKLSFILGFCSGLFIVLIYDILNLMLQLFMFDLYVNLIDSTKSLEIHENIKNVIYKYLDIEERTVFNNFSLLFLFALFNYFLFG